MSVIRNIVIQFLRALKEEYSLDLNCAPYWNILA